MKHVKLVGLALTAAFAAIALLAVAAAGSAAAAGPEWGHCVSVKSKGHYEDSNCTKESFTENKKHVKKYKGHFEWLPGGQSDCVAQTKGKYKDKECTKLDEKNGKAKGKYEKTGGPIFTSEGKSPGILKTTFDLCEKNGEIRTEPYSKKGCEEEGGHPAEEPIFVECTSEHDSGEASGLNEVKNVHVTFDGCKALGAFPAESEGALGGPKHQAYLESGGGGNVGEHPERITVNVLKGRLGYIEPGPPHVGVLLEPETASGLFTRFLIGSVNLETEVGVGNATEGAYYKPEATGGYDGLISPIEPVNTMTHTFKQVYKLSTEPGHEFENVPSHFEGGHIEGLEDAAKYPFEPTQGSAWSGAGEEIADENTVEGEAEIKG